MQDPLCTLLNTISLVVILADFFFFFCYDHLFTTLKRQSISDQSSKPEL